MPLELATPLSYEREPEMDPKVRVEAAEAIYLIALQVYFLVRFLWQYLLLAQFEGFPGEITLEQAAFTQVYDGFQLVESHTILCIVLDSLDC